MVYHSDEIPLDIGFSLTWSAAYTLCVLKLRYKAKLSFPCTKPQFRFSRTMPYFSVTSIALNDVNVHLRGISLIKPFAREIGTSQKFVSL